LKKEREEAEKEMRNDKTREMLQGLEETPDAEG
jgi:hypothetical protein